MKILFATGNKNKIAEAGTLFGELGYDVEGLLVNGNRPNFIEPQCNSLMEVALSKIIQARAMIKNSDLEGCAILVEDSGIFICLLYTSPSPRDVEESRMPSSA